MLLADGDNARQPVPVRGVRIRSGILNSVQRTFMRPLTVIDARIEFSTPELANVRSHLSPFELQTLRTRFVRIARVAHAIRRDSARRHQVHDERG